MIDLFLKTANEQELIDALSFARVVDGNGEGIWMTATHKYALDVVGDVYNNDGVYDEDGEVIAPATKVSGFHANLRLLDESLLDIIPENITIDTPNSPSRVFS